MQTSKELSALLARIDRRGYPAYKDTRGAWRFPGYVLSIDHVQGDPFAAPSRVSVHVDGKTAGFPRDLWGAPCRRRCARPRGEASPRRPRRAPPVRLVKAARPANELRERMPEQL